MRFRCYYLPLLGLTVACAAQLSEGATVKGRARADTGPRSAPVSRTTTSRVIVTPTEAFSINELYVRAAQHAESGSWRLAASEFERAYDLDRTGPLAAGALYNAGVAHDEASAERESQELALSRFRAVLLEFPEQRWAVLASARAMRLAVHLEHWTLANQLVDSFERLTPTPTPTEQALVDAARAMHAIERGQLEEAQRFIDEGLAVIEDHRIDSVGQLPRDVAALYFALGESKRVGAQRIKFVPRPADFAAVLEARCQLVLDAQRAYAEAMRAYDAHWSSMAGVRTSELYASLHHDLMQVPPPASAKTEVSSALFQGAMRLRYSVLLEKALTLLEHTLQMTERTGQRSPWSERAVEARQAILDAKRVEDEALDRLPYTRQELAKALDDLRRKKPRPAQNH